MATNTRKPWLKLWAQDWLTDPKLRHCTAAQRGTLTDLICMAHHHDPYGYFLDNDTPDDRKMLAKCLSISVRTLDRHLSSLLQLSRICQTSDGQMYVPRMVKDNAKSLQGKDNGGKGGNPKLRKGLTPEQSRAEQKEKKKESRTKKEVVVLPFDSDSFKEVWGEYKKHRTKTKAPMTPHAEKLALKKLPSDEATAISWVNHAIEKGWRGIFEPQNGGTVKSQPSHRQVSTTAADSEY